MKIRQLAAVIIGVSILLITLITHFILNIWILDYILKQEDNMLLQSYKHIEELMNRERESLKSTVSDWANWDDTYAFVQEYNEEYVTDNLFDGALETLKLDFMVFINKDKQIVFIKSKGMAAASSDLQRDIKEQLGLLSVDKLSEPASGLLVVAGLPYFISESTISTSDKLSEPNGILLIGRPIGKEYIDYIEKVLNVDFSIRERPIEATGLSQPDAGKRTIEKRVNFAAVTSVLQDINNRPSIEARVEIPRDNYRSGMRAITFFIAFFILALIIVYGICISVINRLILRRMYKFHAFMSTVASSKDTSERIVIPGKDEISQLADSTNKMLMELDQSYQHIKTMEERFRLVMEATNDGYFDANFSKNELYISGDWIKTTGMDEIASIHKYRLYFKRLHPEDRRILNQALKDCIRGVTESFSAEYRYLKTNGEWIWIATRGKVVERDQRGNAVRLTGSLSDITNRKHYEEDILYLSYTDTLTGLYNRSYMETVFKKADAREGGRDWIIMGDVNGLKIINDSLGHLEGDKILQTIGENIKHCCAQNDISARWGGDEFIIYVSEKESKYVENLVTRIKESCNADTRYPAMISIALGIAAKDSDHLSMYSILKLAEERMYRNKLLESRSARNAILLSLEQSLHERHIETEEHTHRTMELCQQMGRQMGLSQDELDELELLAVLHDIGKIAIPEAVLMKNGKLTNEEWRVMETHSEIGYRIASSTPELAHIADEILSHHERYDGTGYPKGLREKEIPKLSRLLAVVDAFDVMTHERLYKKAVSPEEAMAEIQSCSGTQFDPEMVSYMVKLMEEQKIAVVQPDKAERTG